MPWPTENTYLGNSLIRVCSRDPKVLLDLAPKMHTGFNSISSRFFPACSIALDLDLFSQWPRRRLSLATAWEKPTPPQLRPLSNYLPPRNVPTLSFFPSRTTRAADPRGTSRPRGVPIRRSRQSPGSPGAASAETGSEPVQHSPLASARSSLAGRGFAPSSPDLTWRFAAGAARKGELG